jgi:hypothetical protein
MILPSLLEYSDKDFAEKLKILIQKNQDNSLNDLLKITNDTEEKQKQLHLHLDFVMKQFAKDRSGILASLDLESSFKILKEYFSKKKLRLSVHLMGTLEDLMEAWKFFNLFKIPKQWKVRLFLPINQAQAWKIQFNNFEIGQWYDLDQWQDLQGKSLSNGKNFEQYNLLMTVKAGKSGQKLTPETKNKIHLLLEGRSEYFLLDGGWNQATGIELISDFNKPPKIDFVSYSGFWPKLKL